MEGRPLHHVSQSVRRILSTPARLNHIARKVAILFLIVVWSSSSVFCCGVMCTMDTTLLREVKGQRIYGPPPQLSHLVPPKGSEIFVGKLPRNIYEEELYTMFSKVGTIYELRLMMSFSKSTRGYSFISYMDSQCALRAVQLFDHFEIRPGHRIGVAKSIDNSRLFVKGIPMDLSREEIFEGFAKHTSGMKDVYIYHEDKDTSKNRGYAVIEYKNHKAASSARRELIPNKDHLWNTFLEIDWCKPDIPLNLLTEENSAFQNREMTIKAYMKEIDLDDVLFARNLPEDASESYVTVLFSLKGKVDIIDVKKIHRCAFIHYLTWDEALMAVNETNGMIVRDEVIEVLWAKDLERLRNSYGTASNTFSLQLGSGKTDSLTAKKSTSSDLMTSPKPTSTHSSDAYDLSVKRNYKKLSVSSNTTVGTGSVREEAENNAAYVMLNDHQWFKFGARDSTGDSSSLVSATPSTTPAVPIAGIGTCDSTTDNFSLFSTDTCSSSKKRRCSSFGNYYSLFKTGAFETSSGPFSTCESGGSGLVNSNMDRFCSLHHYSYPPKPVQPRWANIDPPFSSITVGPPATAAISQDSGHESRFGNSSFSSDLSASGLVYSTKDCSHSPHQHSYPPNLVQPRSADLIPSFSSMTIEPQDTAAMSKLSRFANSCFPYNHNANKINCLSWNHAILPSTAPVITKPITSGFFTTKPRDSFHMPSGSRSRQYDGGSADANRPSAYCQPLCYGNSNHRYSSTAAKQVGYEKRNARPYCPPVPYTIETYIPENGNSVLNAGNHGYNFNPQFRHETCNQSCSFHGHSIEGPGKGKF